MTTFEPLCTERLVLRPPEAPDAADIYAFASSAVVTKYMAWARHTSLRDTDDFLAFSRTEWQRWPVGPLTLRSRSDGALLGATGLAFDERLRASTGYILVRHAWGRGIATEALRAVVGLADRVGVRRLYAHCHVEHTASAHVLDKAGFTREGILQEFLVFPNLGNDDPQDVFSYARTR